MTSGATSQWVKFARRAVSAAIVLACVYFFARGIVRQWPDVRRQMTPQLAANFVWSIPCLALMSLMYAACLKTLLAGAGAPAPFAVAYRLYHLPQFGKYVPGKLWTYLALWRMGQSAGVSGPRLLAAMVILQILGTLASVLVGGALLLPSLPQWRLALGAAVAVSILALALMRPVVTIAAGVVRRRSGARMDFTLPYRNYAAAVALYLGSYVPYLIGCALVFRGFEGVGWLRSANILGALSVAWIVGCYTFISPGGLGVREGVLYFILSRTFSPELSLTIPIILRVWLTLYEILCGALALLAPAAQGRREAKGANRASAAKE